MPGDYLPEDLKVLWKGLSTHPIRISPEELRTSSERLAKELRRRSRIGGGAAWLVIAGFAVYFFIFPNVWQRLGAVLTVAGAAYMLVQLRLRGARRMPEMGEIESIRFYRTELERQRDFHRAVWFWSRLLIFMPGPLIFLVGFTQAYPNLAVFIWMELAAFLIIAAFGVWLNLKQAAKYQRRIDALDSAVGSE